MSLPSPTDIQGIRVVGMDPSLRNWGLATAIYVPGHNSSLHIQEVSVVSPVLSTSKQVRQNSLDLDAAHQLSKAVVEASKGAQVVFIEVPVGSQSARAMASYGICVGILGALRASGVPFFEVTPTEVKLASAGSKTATKQSMIEWATRTHPEANWPSYPKKGRLLICESKAEHMADAVAAIYAGLSCNPFQQLLPFLKAA